MPPFTIACIVVTCLIVFILATRVASWTDHFTDISPPDLQKLQAMISGHASNSTPQSSPIPRETTRDHPNAKELEVTARQSPSKQPSSARPSSPRPTSSEVTSADIAGYSWGDAARRMAMIVEPDVDIRQTPAMAEQARAEAERRSLDNARNATRTTTAEMNSLAIMPAASSNARCGPAHGNRVCGPGQCCNQMGFCGYSAANCMPGENIGFNGVSFAAPTILSAKLSS